MTQFSYTKKYDLYGWGDITQSIGFFLVQLLESDAPHHYAHLRQGLPQVMGDLVSLLEKIATGKENRSWFGVYHSEMMLLHCLGKT